MRAVRLDIHRANLRRANLSGADLSDANLSDALAIACAGPVGRSRRIIYAVRHGDGVMMKLGCWWGGLTSTIARVEKEYAGDPWLDAYLGAVRSVAAIVMVTP